MRMHVQVTLFLKGNPFNNSQAEVQIQRYSNPNNILKQTGKNWVISKKHQTG